MSLKLIEGILNLESPQMIDLDPFEVSSASKEIKDNLSKSEVIEQHSDEVSLRHLPLRKHSYYFLYDSSLKEVTYFVRYRQIELGLPSCSSATRQVLVYRNKSINSGFRAGIAQEVFWNYLFPKTGCLVSDSMQSQDGRSFWEYVVKSAFERNLSVKLINTNNQTIEDCSSLTEFNNKVKELYGSSKWFQRFLIAVTK